MKSKNLKELEEIEKSYRQLRNRQQVEVRQATLNENKNFYIVCLLKHAKN